MSGPTDSDRQNYWFGIVAVLALLFAALAAVLLALY